MSQVQNNELTYPSIGDVCRIRYPKYNIDDYVVCTGLEYLPGDVDRPKVRVTVRRVRKNAATTP